jgi:fructose-bisphosphate aldolase, class II
MTIARTGDLVRAAAERGAAVGAFNVVTLEHAEAIVQAAEGSGTSVIVQLSENAVRFHGGAAGPIAAACTVLARGSSVPIALHLDHVTDEALADQAEPCGFSSLMFDAGALAHGENVRRTRAAAERAHAAGLWLEAELGYVGGKPDAPRSAHAPGVRTDPDEAVAYVRDTAADALAVAVGSSHAMTTQSATLDVELIARLRERLDVPLVLHGSSGVPDEALRAAVRAGIAKVNVGTALGQAMTASIRRSLDADPALVDPRKFLAPARDAIAGAVRHILTVLG